MTDDQEYLRAILRGISWIEIFKEEAKNLFPYEEWLHGKTLDVASELGRKFYLASMYESALAFQLLLIGEAASKISQPIKYKSQHIKWRDIINTRNRLGHKPWELDKTFLDDVVTNHLPQLDEQIQALQIALIEKRF